MPHFRRYAKLNEVICPSCGQRKARRACPALRQSICPFCCGTKRLVEISCPADCPYLAAAREHPPAVVRRQQEQDVAVLLPSIRHLTERQYQLFFLFHSVIAQHRPEGFVRLLDDDVAEAAAATAATLETAARGVIYAHVADSAAAQRLAKELAALLAQIREQGATVSDGEAAPVLRAIERGAREVRNATDKTDTAYVTLMARLLQANQAQRDIGTPNPPSPIVLP